MENILTRALLFFSLGVFGKIDMMCQKGRGSFFMPEKLKSFLNFAEALDNLSILPEADVEDPYRIGVLNDRKIVIQEEEASYPGAIWLTSNSAQDFLTLAKKCFQAMYAYLLNLEEEEGIDWENQNTTRGLKALITLSLEAALKIDAIIEKIDPKLGKRALSSSEEYIEFSSLYEERFAEEHPEIMQGDKAWSKEWLEHRNFLLYEMSQKGLKDFETVKRDQEYELFYLKTEEGRPFFHPHLMRNIKLVWDISELESPMEEDPLLILADLKDKQTLSLGIQILKKTEEYIKAFYEMKIRRKSNSFIQALNKSVMALMLAADSKHLLENQSRKRAVQYFHDFRLFLQEALFSHEYGKWIAYPPGEEDKEARFLIKMVHKLCEALFVSEFGIKKEILGLIHRIARKGEEAFLKEKKAKASSFLEKSIQENEYISYLLSFYPSGPLLKILDVIRGDDQDHEDFFSPLLQDNFPFHLYSISLGKKEVFVLRIPSPTYQKTIDKVSLVKEFIGFLRSYAEDKKTHLLINLQDRTSWRERGRSLALERLEHQAEFHASFFVVGFSKDSDFYQQKQEYRDLKEASSFIDIFVKQLENPEEFGFYISSKIASYLLPFAKKLFRKIHEHFFSGKKELERQERQDFIEIAYQFLFCKILEEEKVDSLSFTCKDALDVGQAEAFLFFAFLECLQGESLETHTETTHLLLYAASLMIRERGIDSERLHRALSSLGILEKNRGALKKLFSELYAKDFFVKV